MSLIPHKQPTDPASIFHLEVPARWNSPAQLIHDLELEGRAPFVLLDSAGGDRALCRFSMLAWEPGLEVRIRDGRAAIRRSARAAHAGVRGERQAGKCQHDNRDAPECAYEETIIEARDPFSLLRELIAEAASRGSVELAGELGLPLAGGAFGMVGYDAGRYIERLPDSTTDDLELPDFHFIFPRKLICFDHARQAAHLLFEDPQAGELDLAREALDRQRPREASEAVAAGPAHDRHTFDLSSNTRSNMEPEAFKNMVCRAKEYILAGDIFQSNLSQRLELVYDGDSLDLYEALRSVNPSPFAGYLDMGDYQLISSSPERLVQLTGRGAQTRPIAGTRRRGVDDSEDGSLTEELNLDPKERAEHIMLVDLERNDMGRVCDYGSVRVDELMVNEAYSHVIHIVSNVKGELHDGKDALDLLRAMFPGGTITGCPKVRCMEIIDELEPVRRGAYTGSFGYIGFNGDMDLNIIIRTLVRRGDSVYAQVGAGIVADSDPEREYHETLRKAEAMMRAVELERLGRRRGHAANALSAARK